MAPTVQHVINNWAAATELRLPSMHTAHPHCEDLPLKADFQMFSDLTNFSTLRNGWGWLIEQRKRMARAVSGYFWSSFLGIPGSGRSDVWWALDRPGVSFLTKIKYLYYCLYLYIVHCTCTVVLWFYFCSLWRLNWDWIETELKVEFCSAAFSTFYKLLPGADFEEFSRVCIFPSCQERIREIFFSSQGRILEICWEQKNLQLFAAEQVSDHVEGGLSLCNHLH